MFFHKAPVCAPWGCTEFGNLPHICRVHIGRMPFIAFWLSGSLVRLGHPSPRPWDLQSIHNNGPWTVSLGRKSMSVYWVAAKELKLSYHYPKTI